MELRRFGKVVGRWWWLVILGVMVAALSTLYATRNETPLYSSTTTLLVGQSLQQQDPSSAEMYTAQTLARTYVELAYRQPVQEATQKALGMDWLPGYTVDTVPNTQLMEITVIDSDPDRAVVVADELARQLIAQTPSGQGSGQHEAFVQEQLSDLEASIKATQAEIARLETALAGMFSAREIANTENQIAALQQKVASAQYSYGQLLVYTGQGAVNALSVVEWAVPGSRVGSSRQRTVMLGAIVGLVLGLATAFLLEYLDDTLKTPEDIQETMGVTTLAGITRIPGESPREKLVTVKHPKSAISEAYRVLRTNLQFSSLDQPLGTLVVTSPNPVEGKSTTAANLAVVTAQAGKSVVLVDADLRRPVLHRAFGVENKQGLTTVLLEPELSLDGNLQPTEVENLRVLTSGPLPPNPSELLGSQRMGTLIEMLKREADVVIFDTPPSLAVTDASVLATQVDGVLLVADFGRTRRNLARAAAERFRHVGANLVGATLNRLRPGRRGYSYYYYYYQYQYAYGSDGKRQHRTRGLARWVPWLRAPRASGGGDRGHQRTSSQSNGSES